MPTMQALLPALVPPQLLSRAIAANASAGQTAIIAGPALGGIIYVAGPAAVYAVSTALFLLTGLMIFLIRIERRRAPASARPVVGSRRHSLHPQPAGRARRDIARHVRRAARRRDGAAADLRARHPAHRAVGPRPAALAPGGRRAGDGAVARAPPAATPRGPEDVRRGRRVRRRRRSCSAVASFALSLVALSCSARPT